jgi:toxin ParE1/3/4
MPRVIRSPEAQLDIDEIARHIAQDNMNAALRWLDSLDEQLKKLAHFPGMGPKRDELGAGLRSWPLGNYLIFYRDAKGGIEVARVLHGARNLRRVFRRRRRRPK